jgi:hypothetical protein
VPPDGDVESDAGIDEALTRDVDAARTSPPLELARVERVAGLARRLAVVGQAAEQQRLLRLVGDADAGELVGRHGANDWQRVVAVGDEARGVLLQTDLFEPGADHLLGRLKLRRAGSRARQQWRGRSRRRCRALRRRARARRPSSRRRRTGPSRRRRSRAGARET